MRIEPLGDSALLVRLEDEFHPEKSLNAVLRATEALAAENIPGVLELVPAYTTIGVFYEPTQSGTFEELEATIKRALGDIRERKSDGARMVEVPVCYDGEFAVDLEEVARHCGLSPAAVVERHSSATYRVSCVGFTPGFPYLSGLPNELATSRRSSPRKEVPAGAVAIGGSQTGIYPRKSPGGWNIIGRTPMGLFDVERTPPALFQAGDRVRIRIISREEFDGFSQ